MSKYRLPVPSREFKFPSLGWGRRLVALCLGAKLGSDFSRCHQPRTDNYGQAGTREQQGEGGMEMCYTSPEKRLFLVSWPGSVSWPPERVL